MEEGTDAEAMEEPHLLAGLLWLAWLVFLSLSGPVAATLRHTPRGPGLIKKIPYIITYRHSEGGTFSTEAYTPK